MNKQFAWERLSEHLFRFEDTCNIYTLIENDQGECFQWEGMEFTIHYTPGHADYRMGMFAQIDGHSVAFSGDNIFPLSASTPSLIYHNHVHKRSHQQTARLYLEYMPDILCTGHDLQREVNSQVYTRFAEKVLQMTQLFEEWPPGEANFGLEPSWVQIYPYQSLARAGDTLNLQKRMTNFLTKAAQAEVKLVLPDGWIATPIIGHLDLPSHQRSQADFKVHIPDTYLFPYPREAIAANVIFNGPHLGQCTEATIEQAV